ncbi:MAG: acyl--CoA ligase [Nocardia sp.]|nr:acyl--CoA ligase [Nocardia sp.]
MTNAPISVFTEPATIADLIREHAHACPTRALLICDSERLTFAEAEELSARLARGLIALGAWKGSHIGVLYPNSADFVVSVLAAARIGAVVVPLSTFSTTRELREQLAHSDVHILLATTGYRSHDYGRRVLEVLGDPVVDSEGRIFSPAVPQLRHVILAGAAESPLLGSESVLRLADSVNDAMLRAHEADVGAGDPLMIVYTSGSTSAPKGVVHSQGASLTHQRNLNAIRGLVETDVMYCNSPLFWIGGFAYAFLATLVAGATLLCSNSTDDETTLDLLEEEKPTIANGFVAPIAHLPKHPSFSRRDLSSLRRGNLYPLMPAEVRPKDPQLRHNLLGMTETGSVVLLSGDAGDQPEHRRGSFGKPAPGFEMRIVDLEDGAPVDSGVIGELCFRGPYLMRGYYKRSREESFDPDGWFHTGDLARTDDDGFVYYLGRSGAMIKTAGANVAPAEVERAITEITGGPAHVLGLPDPQRGQVVAAVLAVEDPAAFDEARLRERLRADLSAYKVPARFAAVTAEEIPIMSSGKVDLPGLKRLFE